MTTEKIAERVQFAYWVPNVSGGLVTSTIDQQYNDGFRTKLIGTPEQIAERIVAYRRRGVDLILADFLHVQEEVEYFGANVLPLVRELEAQEQPAAVAS